MNDNWIDDELFRSLKPPKEAAPAFDATLRAAEARLAARTRRLRAGSGIAAMVAVVAVAVGLSLRGPEAPGVDLRIEEALLGTTQWAAPSDVLLPTHEFDIYRDTPALPGSTETLEGTFL